MSHTNNKDEKTDARLEAVRFWEEKFPIEYKDLIERIGEVSISLGFDKGQELADSIKNTITALHQELQKDREATIHRILAIVSSKQNQYTSTYERGYQDCVKNILESIHHYQSKQDQSELDQPIISN